MTTRDMKNLRVSDAGRASPARQRQRHWRRLWRDPRGCHAGDRSAAAGAAGNTVALLGMPITGKSTLYNRLTGGNAPIANWPGLTVDLQCGPLPPDRRGQPFTLVDLPGIHDLSGGSEDEAVVQRFLRRTPPDLILLVLNASQITSQLRLVLEVRQLGIPLVVALNMSDEARRLGIRIDTQRLSAVLAAPVVAISARRNQGIHAVIDALHSCGERQCPGGG